MNAFRRIVMIWVAAVVAALPFVGTVLGQGMAKPALVVSIAKPDKLLADVGYLTRAAGTPEFGGLVTLMAGPYLQGIDTRRPIGVLLQFAGPQPTGVAFLPVTNLAQIIKQLEDNSIEVQDAGGGIKKIELQRTVYFKEVSGWVYLSDADSNLASLPANPAELLGTLPEQYDLAIQVNARNVDASLIDLAVSELRAGFERTLEAETDPEQRELQQKLGRQSMDNMIRLIQETSQLTIGWGVDSNAGKTFVDFSLTAVPETKLARQMATYSRLTSGFAGFEMPGAAASLRFTAPVAKEDLEQAREGLKSVRAEALKGIDQSNDLPNEEARAVLKQVVGTLIDLVLATAEAGKVDGGAALLLGANSIQVVAGGFVADGEVIQTELKKLSNLSKQVDKNDARIEELKFNAAKHQGVDFHTFSVPVPADEEQARQLLGQKLNVVVGTGAKSAYLALGNGSVDLVKQVIDGSRGRANQEVTPMELTVSVSSILEFAAGVQGDPMVRMLADTIKKTNGKDHIRLSQKTIPQGITGRLEIEDGVLQLIGAAAKARNNLGN